MDLAWIATTVANIRREPDERSERVSQHMIFTVVEVLEMQRGWAWVQGPDGCSGWVKESQICLGLLTPPLWKVRMPWVQVRKARGQGVLGILPLDARFAGEERGQKVFMRWLNGEMGWVPRKALRLATWQGTVKELVQAAYGLVGVPYLWGGTTPFGFDCSGFVQRLFHFVFNLWLPRNSRDQQDAGVKIFDFSNLRLGDILCFPGHTALFVGQERAIHASSRFGSVVVTHFATEPYGKELHQKFLFGVRVLTKTA